jgi:hypothetical protein
MVKIEFGEGMNSQISTVGLGRELSPDSVIKISSGFHLVNIAVTTCGYFLWDEEVGDGLQSQVCCQH